ncbi:hypothetical protein N7466_009015 [Penicillium verhagenii]|uniref:uncharacterized protein n=1 Tax=Penicillium verhagenii TaxID=1562060 RepID=UPI002545078D|nr:uncharacterized protein N7466_009015 [Penicillium verhagenii]KAJ5924828.1 hypothetical protein N7466_009015 [Penicillium verhagenii]
MEFATSHTSSKHRIPGLPNPVVAEAEKKWLFLEEELERTPSRLDKIDREQEDYIRHRAVQFIWQVSMMLKMPPQTSMTATVFMHRFLMRYSLRGQYPEQGGDLMHPKVIAAVALFVAFKVDETMRRMKDFVVACCRVAMKQPEMIVDEQSKDYWKWRDLILQNESVLLEVLCFDLTIESPYRILWDYSLFLNVPDNRPLRHAAYAFLNDSTYTVLSLLFESRVIAAAALYAAARHCKVSFPDDSQGRPWWEQIDVRVEDLITACRLIVKIYERVQQNLSKNYPDFTISDADPNDPTRLFHSNPLSVTDHTSSLSTPAADSPAGSGRKRSREPESFTADNYNPSPIPMPQAPSTFGGEPSQKRQRTLSPAPILKTPQDPSQPSTSSLPRIPLRAMASLPPKPTLQNPSNKDGVSDSRVVNDGGSTEEGEVSDEKEADKSNTAVAPQENPPDGEGSEEGEI